MTVTIMGGEIIKYNNVTYQNNHARSNYNLSSQIYTYEELSSYEVK